MEKDREKGNKCEHAEPLLLSLPKSTNIETEMTKKKEKNEKNWRNRFSNANLCKCTEFVEIRTENQCFCCCWTSKMPRMQTKWDKNGCIYNMFRLNVFLSPRAGQCVIYAATPKKCCSCFVYFRIFAVCERFFSASATWHRLFFAFLQCKTFSKSICTFIATGFFASG